jgi:hypothetical protein
VFARHTPPTPSAFSRIVNESIPARRSWIPIPIPPNPAPTITILGVISRREGYSQAGATPE